ncbi:MAG TPA: prepilin-type N-terminal cleavage/methylation domain-containing protein [Candidatus Saccharimonadales bacterium]|nr:prepilin-type N-terminal cleavage/methylation domain-containing protein [Candidatus Saccharimonadales bacterium]
MKNTASNQKGFTIVELMIALAVMSTLLLIASLTLINLGHLFSKGTNEANLQNATRNLMSDLTSSIELGATKPVTFYPSPLPVGSLNLAGPGAPGEESPSSTGTEGCVPGALVPGCTQVGVICIGTVRYTYVLNHVLTNDSGDHALWRDTTQNNSVCQPVDATFDTFTTNNTDPHDDQTVAHTGSELLLPNMRLTQLCVGYNSSSNTYTIRISAAYGGNLADGTQDLVQFDRGNDPTDCTDNSGKTSCLPTKGDEYCATSSLVQTVVQRTITE